MEDAWWVKIDEDPKTSDEELAVAGILRRIIDILGQSLTPVEIVELW